MITIIIIIVIIPHSHPLPCNKPIKDKLQRATHNSTALKVNDKTEDKFICASF